MIDINRHHLSIHTPPDANRKQRITDIVLDSLSPVEREDIDLNVHPHDWKIDFSFKPDASKYLVDKLQEAAKEAGGSVNVVYMAPTSKDIIRAVAIKKRPDLEESIRDAPVHYFTQKGKRVTWEADNAHQASYARIHLTRMQAEIDIAEVIRSAPVDAFEDSVLELKDRNSEHVLLDENILSVYTVDTNDVYDIRPMCMGVTMVWTITFSSLNSEVRKVFDAAFEQEYGQ